MIVKGIALLTPKLAPVFKENIRIIIFWTLIIIKMILKSKIVPVPKT